MDKSTLLELRRQAGYRSAREFADAFGIPQTTYARWESQPEKIPTEKAWELADRLGSTIDAVVGRIAIDDEAPGARVRRSYEALSPQSRRTIDDVLDFLSERERESARRAAHEEMRRWVMLCRQYLAAFERDRENEAGFAVLQTFGSPEEKREEFERYIVQRAEEARDPGDEEAPSRDADSVAKIMEAYDLMAAEAARRPGRLRSIDVGIGGIGLTATYEEPSYFGSRAALGLGALRTSPAPGDDAQETDEEQDEASDEEGGDAAEEEE